MRIVILPQKMEDSDDGSSVTLIFYKIDSEWYKGSEPLLNIIAAAAQGSVFTHIEVAIGEASGENGRMKNVLRIFNDPCGVELAERTGINPAYSYLQLGCSKRQEAAMLGFAKAQIGKPFSQTGMARSIFWPRKSDHKSWYCAELVAACLQAGRLMSSSSSTGSATPSSLYKLYKNRGAVCANPCVLRRQFGSDSQNTQSNVLGLRSSIPASISGLIGRSGAKSNGYTQIKSHQQPNQPHQPHQPHQQPRHQSHQQPHQQPHQRSSSPPRMSFKQLSASTAQPFYAPSYSSNTVTITLESLNMRNSSR